MENPLFPASRRTDYVSSYCYPEQSSAMAAMVTMEKRQLFLRSYQFSRKKSVSERIKGFTVKVKKVILFRLRTAKKLRRLVWSALCFRRRRFRFLRLVNSDVSCFGSAAGMKHRSSCFW
uniref:Uncharacterized protein n=1 Tax=Kalanchoe fedtschenkoi TaxID=63787 RepID=A0A7N0U7V7_KALFE